MKRTLLTTCTLLGLLGCGASNSLPDGGRGRFICTNELMVLPVKVIDSTGTPVDGAAVSAKNLSNGKSVNGTTDGRGVTTAVNEDLGTGTVRIQASKGGQTSMVFDVNFTCGECDCAVNPRSATLLIQ